MVPTILRLICWFGVSLALLGGDRCASAGFTIVDLGPSGALTGGATAINTSGSTAGYVLGSSGSNQAAFSRAGSRLELIDTSALPGARGSTANAINDANVLAGTFYNSLDGRYHAFAASNGKAFDFGTFASGSLKGADTFGVGISGAGEVVGTARLSDGSSVAFRESSPGQATTISLPGASTIGQAAGVSDNGKVVGSYLNAAGVSRVFTADQNTGLDLLSQVSSRGFGQNTYGSAINNLGSVTGYGDYGGQYHSFVSTLDPITGARTFTDIGLGGGFGSTVSIALNDRGQVVGQMSNKGSNGHAFLWDQTVGVIDLNSLLSTGDRQFWTLTSATGINNSGMIAGQGYYNGQLHGFLLTPIPGTIPFFSPSVVPTPPSIWLALGGMAMAGGWMRIRSGRIADLDAA